MESGLLNNRELTSLLWFAGIASWLLVRHRQSTLGAVRKFAEAFRPVLPHFALYGAWIAIVAVVGSRLGIWNVWLLKATLLWALLSGIGLLASTTDALRGRRWFRRVLVSTIGATAVVEFFVNLKSFPLAVEIVLQPVVFFALVLPMVARDPEHQPVRTIAGWTSALIGFAAVGWTALAVSRQWSDLDLGKLVAEAALPVWLTVGALGFLYPFTLYMAYEQLLKRMTWRAQDKSIWRQRLAVVAYGGPRLSVVQDLQGGNDYDVVHASGFLAAWRAIGRVREQRRSERVETEASPGPAR
jgi:hypothetical protein